MAVHLFKPLKKSGQGAWADRNVGSYLNVTGAQFSGNDPHPLFGQRVLNPQEVFREQAGRERQVATTKELCGGPTGLPKGRRGAST